MQVVSTKFVRKKMWSVEQAKLVFKTQAMVSTQAMTSGAAGWGECNGLM